MGLEQKINYQLNKFPIVKKVVKRAYQYIMYAVSPKIKTEGNITRLSPGHLTVKNTFSDTTTNRLGMLLTGMFSVCVPMIHGQMCLQKKARTFC